jgi:hypothetical protein
MLIDELWASHEEPRWMQCPASIILKAPTGLQLAIINRSFQHHFEADDFH